MKKAFKKELNKNIYGQFQTDGKIFLFTIKELGLSGKGSSPKEAYEDLIDTWNKTYKLLGAENNSIDQNIQLLNKEKKFLKIRNSALFIGIILALIMAVNAAVTPILDLPRTIRHGLLNMSQIVLDNDLGKISNKINSMDLEKKNKLANDISSILIFFEEIQNKAINIKNKETAKSSDKDKWYEF